MAALDALLGGVGPNRGYTVDDIRDRAAEATGQTREQVDEALDGTTQPRTVIKAGNRALNKRTEPSVEPNTLRYPSNPEILTNKSDYVMFGFWNYTPPISNRGNQTQGGGGYANYNQTSAEKAPNDRFKDVILYMPQDIQTSFGAGWGGVGMSATQTGAIQGLFGGADIGEGMRNITGVTKNLITNAIKNAVNAGTGSSLTLNQTLSGVAGQIVNPNTELLYDAGKLRTFNLTFKMVSGSQKESNTIRSIYNQFKKATLPGFGGSKYGDEDVSAFLTVPKLVSVDFMTGPKRNDYLPYYKLCGITSLDLNFTADGTWAAFANGDPVSVEMRIGFMETKLVFSQEVQDNGSGI